MATYTVRVGEHYHQLPPLSMLPWLGSQSMSRTVTFALDCQYDSVPYNSEDVNKLFGLSFGFGGVHHNSARFGWRWSKGDQCIELLAYVYNEGKRNQDEQLRFPVVAQVSLNKPYSCSIETVYDGMDERYRFSVYQYADANRQGLLVAETHVPIPYMQHIPSYGLTHGLYWGGATPAPHDIHVIINRNGK